MTKPDDTIWQCPVCEHMAADLARLQEERDRVGAEKLALSFDLADAWMQNSTLRAQVGKFLKYSAEAELAALRAQVEKVTEEMRQARAGQHGVVGGAAHQVIERWFTALSSLTSLTRKDQP